MEKILRGVMRYRYTTRDQMVKEFQRVRDNPHVSAKLFELASPDCSKLNLPHTP